MSLIKDIRKAVEHGQKSSKKAARLKRQVSRAQRKKNKGDIAGARKMVYKSRRTGKQLSKQVSRTTRAVVRGGRKVGAAYMEGGPPKVAQQFVE